jgi:O-6-methylguanine DNA methyltransferase
MKKLPLPSSGFVTDTVQTKFGWVCFVLSKHGLKECRFMFTTKDEAENSVADGTIATSPVITEKWKPLFVNFFSGKTRSFEQVPLDTSAWTEFQKKVYGAVSSIPYGRTASYGTIASYLGNEKASRAVGNALKKNPVPPVVPCHRVIASDKDMCGFSAVGGVDLKMKLLELEKDNS